MRDIDPELVAEALKTYRPEWKFLVSAQIDGGIYEGKFNLGERCPYASPDGDGLDHATLIELEICTKQLCELSIADMLETNQISALARYDFSELQKNKILATRMKQTFKRKIPRGEFPGRMWMYEKTDEQDPAILYFQGDFGGGSMTIDYLQLVVGNAK